MYIASSCLFCILSTCCSLLDFHAFVIQTSQEHKRTDFSGPRLSQTYPCLHPRLLWLLEAFQLRLCRRLGLTKKDLGGFSLQKPPAQTSGGQAICSNIFQQATNHTASHHSSDLLTRGLGYHNGGTAWHGYLETLRSKGSKSQRSRTEDKKIITIQYFYVLLRLEKRFEAEKAKVFVRLGHRHVRLLALLLLDQDPRRAAKPVPLQFKMLCSNRKMPQRDKKD